MAYLWILLLVLSVSSVVWGAVIHRPRPFTAPPRDVLICAAHSDDCVIMGLEYALHAIAAGRTVSIAYLTCSDPHPGSELARIREREAMAAWAGVGVPSGALHFIDLPESPVDGPDAQDPEQLDRAGRALLDLTRLLPEGAALIVPARGEAHPDHRTVRRLSLEALGEAKRPDLVAYETPEYNNFLSVIHAPRRTFTYLARSLPGLGRVIKPYRGPCNYVCGPPGATYRDGPEALERKKEALRSFESQDGHVLVEYFGHRSLYRRIVDPAAETEHRLPERVLLVAGNVSAYPWLAPRLALGASVVLWGITIIVTAGLGSFVLSRALVGDHGTFVGVTVDSALAVGGVTIAALAGLRRFFRGASVESTLLIGAIGLGLALGSL